MKSSEPVVVVFDRAITFETLKRNCKLHGHPDGYATTIWHSYWCKRNAGQDRTGALNELVRICSNESELKKIVGKTIEEK